MKINTFYKCLKKTYLGLSFQEGTLDVNDIIFLLHIVKDAASNKCYIFTVLSEKGIFTMFANPDDRFEEIKE